MNRASLSLSRISCLAISALILNSTLLAQKATLAIVDLEGIGVSQTEAVALSNRLRNELFRLDAFEVVERGMMTNILTEQNFQMTGCTSNDCLVELGQLLGAEQILGGSISKVEEIITVSVRLIDVETGRVIQVSDYDLVGSLSEILTMGMKEVAVRLSGLKTNEVPIQPDVTTVNGTSRDTARSEITEELLDATSIEDMQSVTIGDSVYFVKCFLGKFNWKPAFIIGIDSKNPNRVQITADGKMRIVKTRDIIKKQPWLIPYANGFGEYYITVGSFVIAYSVDKRRFLKGIARRISWGGRIITLDIKQLIRGRLKQERIITSIKTIALIKIRE